MKKHLSVGYGRFTGDTFDKISMEKLKKKIGYCKEVLDSVAILEPGISTQKGCYYDKSKYLFKGS